MSLYRKIMVEQYKSILTFYLKYSRLSLLTNSDVSKKELLQVLKKNYSSPSNFLSTSHYKDRKKMFE